VIGDIVGKHRVIRKLGEGGMGAAYQVEHPIVVNDIQSAPESNW